MRLCHRQGITVDGPAEVHVNHVDREKGEITLAIRAAKTVRIKKLK